MKYIVNVKEAGEEGRELEFEGAANAYHKFRMYLASPTVERVGITAIKGDVQRHAPDCDE